MMTTIMTPVRVCGSRGASRRGCVASGDYRARRARARQAASRAMTMMMSRSTVAVVKPVTMGRGVMMGRASMGVVRAQAVFSEGGILGESTSKMTAQAMDAFDEQAEPLFYREGQVWRSGVGKASKFTALWCGVLGVAQALFRVVSAPSMANFFEAVGDGMILTFIVAPAAAALLAFVVQRWSALRLKFGATRLPYTISPYADRKASPKQRAALFATAFKARQRHRNFAKVKAARTYASEVASQFATTAIEAPRRVLAVALGLKAFSIANVSSMNQTLDALLLFTLGVAAVSVNLLERRRGPGQMRKEMLFVEQEYLKVQTKGTFLCRWASDPYEEPGERNAMSSDKALTNASVADALGTSCEKIGIGIETSMALVLDAADGRTSKELMSKGVPPSSIWVPNIYTHVVHSLRKDVGVNAVATKVEGFLASRDPRETQLQVIYLDHCGSVMTRTQQLWDVFSRHAVADGGVIAVTFSTRGKREGWTKSAAVQLAAKAIVEAAEIHGYVLEGNAAPNIPGLVDYTVSVPAVLGESADVSTTAVDAAKMLRDNAEVIAEAIEIDDDGVIATALALWLKDTEVSNDSDAALETGKDKRRRKLVDDVTKRSLERFKDGQKPMQSDSKALRSLAREVVDASKKSAELRDPTPMDASKNQTVERTYPKSLYLYNTLMFFVFRVRVAED